MKHSSKIFSNSVYLLLDLAAITFLSFGFWFVVGRMLTPAETGIIFTSWSISTIASIFTIFGLTTASIKLISEEKNPATANNLIQISLKYTFVMNLILIIVFLLAHQYLAALLQFSLPIVLFTALNMLSISLNNMSNSFLSGFQKMKKIFFTDLAGYTFKLISVPILIFIGLSSIGPLASLFGAFILIFLLRVKKSWFSLESHDELKNRLFKYALPSFISSIASIFFSNIQYIILTVLKNPGITGIFGYASLVSSPLDLIPITLASALFPIISNLSAKNAQKMQNYLLNLVTRYSLMIVLPLAVFLIYFARQFFSIFFPQYLESVSLLPFLIPGTIFLGIGSIFVSSIYAVKKPNTSRNINIFNTLIFVALSIPMTMLFSAKGLAFSYMISTFTLFLLGFYYLRKYVSVKFDSISFLKLFIATIIFLGLLVSTNYIPAPFILKVFLLVIFSAFYFILLLIMKFFIKEDVNLVKAIGRRSPILQSQILHFAEFLEKRI